MSDTLPDTTLFKDFESASHSALAFLHQRLGFDLWMMTRTEGDDWIVLQANDHGYDVKEGTVFNWADSFCSHMVLGKGPRIAPRAADVPVYATAPIAQQVKIGAYIGVPVNREDGSLFGMLCAVDPDPQRQTLEDELPLIEMLATLLGSLLASEQKTIKQQRQIEQTQEKANTDALTGLLNRRGWEKNVETEESRAKRYGTPLAIVMIDLDGLKEINDTEGHAAGDALIRNTAVALRCGIREHDIVARIGGDEFAVLALDCDQPGADALAANIKNVLTENKIEASLGTAIRHPARGLSTAIDEADKAMYADKATHHSSDA